MSRDLILDQLVAASRELFSVPAIAVKLLEVTAQPRADAVQLKQCIEQDPALAAKVLRVVNSSMFGLASPVADLAQAIALLGNKPLELLVLGFTLPEQLQSGVSADVLARYWDRTFTKAAAARELARLSGLNGDEAFLVGLLGDIGMLAMIQGLDDSYRQFVYRVWSTGGDMITLERRALGFDHVQFTVRLLKQWQLPDVICDLVASTTSAASDLPTAIPAAGPLTGVLQQAQRFLDALNDQRPDAPPLSPEFSALWDAVKQQVAQLSEVFAVSPGAPRSHREVLGEAHRRLVIASASAAAELASHTRNLNLLAGADDDAEQHLVDDLDALTDTVRRAHTPTESPAVTHSGTHRAATTSTTATEAVGPKLLSALRMTVNICRQSRFGFSLLLIERRNTAACRQIDDEEITQACQQLDHTGKFALPLGNHRWGVIFPRCDQQAAAGLGQDLIRRLGIDRVPSDERPVVSLGIASVAIPAKNFEVERIFDAAERCRHASEMVGGAIVKSIEIY